LLLPLLNPLLEKVEQKYKLLEKVEQKYKLLEKMDQKPNQATKGKSLYIILFF